MKTNKEHIGVVGIGKLGLCFALNLDAVGYQVTGLDANEAYVDILRSKTLKSQEPYLVPLLQHAEAFEATSDWDKLLNSDIRIFFIVVATPSLPDGGYDHRQVDAVLEKFENAPQRDFTRHLVVMCTTMPGYCDRAAARFEGLPYALSYNPEFIAQGTIVHNQRYPDQVLIGEANQAAGDAIEAVYRKMALHEPTYCRMSRISAEITKLATNCFLTTKISFANSIGDLAKKVGAEPDKILAAVGADKRIGNRYLNYGFGYGGPCFPRDNRALGKFGKDVGMEILLSGATDEVNRRHLDFQFEQYLQQYPEDQQIVFQTVTYKPGTVILEESQQLELAVRLAKAGRKVLVVDLPAVIEELQGKYGNLFQYAELKA